MKRRTKRSQFGLDSLEHRWLMAAGALDTSFGTSGIVNPVSSGDASAVCVQSDGKTVVAGTTGDANSSATIARYNLDGSLDVSFGPSHSGRVTVHSGDTDKDSRVYAVTEQNDGSILVAETIDYTIAGNTGELGIIRLTPQGILDKSFDGDGKVNIALSDQAIPRSIAIDASGKILIAGQQITYHYLSDATLDSFIVRLNSNGSADNSFNGNGQLIVAAPDYFASVVVDRTGNSATNPYFNTIVAAGSNGARIMVYRFNNNGSIDNAFDGDGSAWISYPGDTGMEVSGMVMQGDGKLVVSASSGGRTQLATTRNVLLAASSRPGRSMALSAAEDGSKRISVEASMSASESSDPSPGTCSCWQ